jgi:hypothetical protein
MKAHWCTVDEEASHVPTADAVSRVFGVPDPASDASGSDGEGPEETLEEINFEDLARMQAEVDALAAKRSVQATNTSTTLKTAGEAAMVEVREKFTGFYIDTKPAPVRTRVHSPREVLMVLSQVQVSEAAATRPAFSVTGNSEGTFANVTPSFFIDTTANLSIPATTHNYVPTTSAATPALGVEDDDDEEIIVYVAPHPRQGHAPVTPTVRTPTPVLPQTSMLTGTNTTRAVGDVLEPAEAPHTTIQKGPPLGSISAPAPSIATTRFAVLGTATPPRRLAPRRAHPKAGPRSALAARRQRWREKRRQ